MDRQEKSQSLSFSDQEATLKVVKQAVLEFWAVIYQRINQFVSSETGKVLYDHFYSDILIKKQLLIVDIVQDSTLV
ncbi:hypothetical protein [Crocosphaera sp.]|uniref:hypothetical protein n=1 Tax=Crocosphaera sp. TaxID=2729996 RepID=UPI002627EA1B|nr:hypothetical protein [Crocosphaera sp.]MDJ0580428.1 hypothetical protein [Crocosphaera sp.]